MKAIDRIKEAFARIHLDNGENKGKMLEESSNLFPTFSWPSETTKKSSPTAPIPDGLLTSSPITMISGRRLMETLGYRNYTDEAGRIDKGIMQSAQARLARMGIEIVPDSRCPFRIKADDEFALFATTQGMPLHITYRSADLTVIYLAVWLIQNDFNPTSDLAKIDKWIVESTPRGRSPLPFQGFARWLLSRKRILSQRVKKRTISQMARFVHKRARALQLLMLLVSGTENLSGRRIANLEKLLPLFGLRSDDVHGMLHRYITDGNVAESKSPATANEDKVPRLDTSRLAAIQKDTEKAREVLDKIFSDEEEEKSSPVSTTRQNSETSPTESLLRILATKERWSTEDFSQLCSERGILPGAALENINDYSYETVDLPVVEEDDGELIVDIHIANTLLMGCRPVKST